MGVRREQLVQAAEKLVARGKIEAAIREYRKVLSESPNDPTTLNRVGDLYARIERFPEAVGLFTQIAENYTHDGFFVKAIAIYKKIIKLDPTRLEVYERLAELYHRQGLVNEARTQYQVLADYYLKHENAASALSIYQRLAELEPDDPSPRVKLAELYLAQQLTDKALGEYRTIAELMIEHGHAAQAAQVYERALDIHPDDLGFVRDAVAALRRAGSVEAAERFLAAAVRHNPKAEKLLAAARDEAGPAAVTPAVEEAEPEPVPPPQPLAPSSRAASEVEPERLTAAEATAGDALVLDLDEADLGDLASAAAEAEAALAGWEAEAGESERAQASPPSGEIELDLDDVFVLDFDDDAPPASLVEPPPDLDEPATASGSVAPPAGPAAGRLEIAPPPDLEELDFGWEEAAAPEVGPAAEPQVESDALSEAARPGEAGGEAAAGAAATAAAGDALEIDPDFLEQTVAELQPRRPRHAEDLFTEAEVLAKYSLEEKAAERLHEVLRLDPGHLEAMALLIRIDLAKRHYPTVANVAAAMARVSRERGETALWRKVRARLVAAGFELDGDRVTALPERPADREEKQLGRMLAGLLDQSQPQAPQPAGKPPRGRVDETLAALAAEILAPEPEVGQPAPPPAAPEAAEPAATEIGEDSGVRWLDEVAEPAADDFHGAAAEVPPAPVPDVVFDEEDEFFDLAAELEQELGAEGSFNSDELVPTHHEQSLEEIVEGFKRGVAETLSAEDYDTHFNLGIAYREMGLIDEAIGEFQLAAKDLSRLVECSSMLGLCFLDKGLPELALKWYRRGLAAPGLAEDDQLGLLYDLGNAHLASGDREGAYSCFVEVYGINSNYRDVVAKLEEIASRDR